MTTQVDEIVNAVARLEAERDALRALLDSVLAGEFTTDGDRIVLRVPRAAFNEAHTRLS